MPIILLGLVIFIISYGTGIRFLMIENVQYSYYAGSTVDVESAHILHMECVMHTCVATGFNMCSYVCI